MRTLNKEGAEPARVRARARGQERPTTAFESMNLQKLKPNPPMS